MLTAHLLQILSCVLKGVRGWVDERGFAALSTGREEDIQHLSPAVVEIRVVLVVDVCWVYGVTPPSEYPASLPGETILMSRFHVKGTPEVI